MRRYHKRRKRQAKRNLFPLIGASLLILGLFALEYWELFLYGVIILGVVVVLYVTFKIIRHMRKTAPSKPLRDSRYISPHLRQAIWERDSGRCVQCQSESLLEYDHIIPISKGGATSYGNLQILCRSCNRHKSDHI